VCEFNKGVDDEISKVSKLKLTTKRRLKRPSVKRKGKDDLQI